MKKNKFSPEVGERAVKVGQEQRGEYPSLWASESLPAGYLSNEDSIVRPFTAPRSRQLPNAVEKLSWQGERSSRSLFRMTLSGQRLELR